MNGFYCFFAGGSEAPTVKTRGLGLASDGSRGHLKVGAEVQLRFMSLRPELNGKSGVLSKFFDTTGRWEVKLDETEERVPCKVTQLEVVV